MDSLKQRPTFRRLFIGFFIPSEVRERLIWVQKELSPQHKNMKWSSPEKFHVTLVFLGHVDHDKLPTLLKIIQEDLKPQPMVVSYQGIAYMQTSHYGGIVYAKVLCQELEFWHLKFKNRIENSLSLRLEKKPFKPHVTPGRVKEGSPELPEHLKNTPLGIQKDPHFHLIESVPIKSGRRIYQTIQLPLERKSSQ